MASMVSAGRLVAEQRCTGGAFQSDLGCALQLLTLLLLARLLTSQFIRIDQLGFSVRRLGRARPGHRAGDRDGTKQAPRGAWPCDAVILPVVPSRRMLVCGFAMVGEAVRRCAQQALPMTVDAVFWQFLFLPVLLSATQREYAR